MPSRLQLNLNQFTAPNPASAVPAERIVLDCVLQTVRKLKHSTRDDLAEAAAQFESRLQDASLRSC